MPSALNVLHPIRVGQAPSGDDIGPRGGHEVEVLLGDVRVDHDHRNICLMRLVHGGEEGLALGLPDDDRVDPLPDQIFELPDLASGVERDASTMSPPLRLR